MKKFHLTKFYKKYMMKIMEEKLDTTRLRIELAKFDRNQTWLAKKCGVTKSYISYLVKNKSTRLVECFAEALDLEPKDLIK